MRAGADQKAIAYHFRVAGRAAVSAVLLDGHALPQSEALGCVTWQDACSTLFLVTVPWLAPGEHEWGIALA